MAVAENIVHAERLAEQRAMAKLIRVRGAAEALASCAHDHLVGDTCRDCGARRVGREWVCGRLIDALVRVLETP